jgi:hypothetical protein
MEQLVLEAAARFKATRSAAPIKPTAVRDDRAAILGISSAHNCEAFGRAWLAHKMGNLAEFRQALAAKLAHDKWAASLR